MSSPLRLLILMGCMQAAGMCAAQPVPGMPAAPATAAVPAPHAAEPAAMGRLFFTPAQRAALDELRRRPQAVAQQGDRAPLPPAPEYVTLNGVVRRSDGVTTVWLNDKPVRGRQSDDGLRIVPSKRAGPPSGITVVVPQTGRAVDLKVGQQLEVNSGEVKERYRMPPRPGGGAETPATASGQEATSTLAQRRANRERETLRDLLREIESPAGAAPDVSSKGAAQSSPGP
jgi:hypothetical protein